MQSVDFGTGLRIPFWHLQDIEATTNRFISSNSACWDRMRIIVKKRR